MNTSPDIKFPASLPFNGGSAMLAGRGREQNTAFYISHHDGHGFTAAAGVIISNGPAFAIARLPYNQAIGTVQIRHEALQCGRMDIGSHILMILAASPDGRARALNVMIKAA